MGGLLSPSTAALRLPLCHYRQVNAQCMSSFFFFSVSFFIPPSSLQLSALLLSHSLPLGRSRQMPAGPTGISISNPTTLEHDISQRPYPNILGGQQQHKKKKEGRLRRSCGTMEILLRARAEAFHCRSTISSLPQTRNRPSSARSCCPPPLCIGRHSLAGSPIPRSANGHEPCPPLPSPSAFFHCSLARPGVIMAML